MRRLNFPPPALLILPAVTLTLGVTFTNAHFEVPRSSSATPRIQQAEDPPRGISTDDLPIAEPARGRRLLPEEVTAELVRKADAVLWDQSPPYGAEFLIELRDRLFIGRIERHFHEWGGPKHPWGPHKGVTIYRAE